MANLFNQKVSCENQVHELLRFFKKEVPHIALLAVVTGKKRLTLELIELFASIDIDTHLTSAINYSASLTLPPLNQSREISFYISALQVILIIIPLSQDSHHTDITALTCFALRDYFNSKKIENIEKKIVIPKKQLNRRTKVIENKYHEILEEVEKNYTTIHKQQEEYSITLQSEIAQQTQELRKSKKDAEATNMAKSQFLATMSHEIRTPMNGVLGFTDLLLANNLNSEQRENVGMIKRSAETLLNLINDILDYSKTEAGQMSLEYISFDPEIPAFDVCDIIRLLVNEKPIELLCRIDERLPAKVEGDPGRYRQVLLNLLSNAAKFTDKGEIELSLEMEQEDLENITILSRVRDTGIEISREKHETIF
ncbi:MAG: hypothetical protein GY705_24940 [Bacteroidetes bacterium]|nr:hypothetical protein [Bacteroidota bacterium]